MRIRRERSNSAKRMKILAQSKDGQISSITYTPGIKAKPPLIGKSPAKPAKGLEATCK